MTFDLVAIIFVIEICIPISLGSIKREQLDRFL